MGRLCVWAVKMNCLRLAENIATDLSVSTPRKTFSPGWTGGSVKNKSDDCWTLVQAVLRRQWAENRLRSASPSSSEWIHPREAECH